MRIVYLTAGAASRYCGSCLHDNGLARALISQGEDVLLVPMYTPLRTDEENVSQKRLFFGGVNVFLQQSLSVFRRTPWFIDRWFDSPRLVRWLSDRSAGMEVAKLGALAVSTLQGEHGHQRKELEKLIRWLADEARPQIVHLSNALLVGMIPRIRETLHVPIVCGLAGEDWFVEQLREPHYSQARRLLRERAKDVDAFVAYNQYFADFMADYLAINRSRIEVIRHGLDLTGHGQRRGSHSGDPFAIGYFGRVSSEKGLHLLVEAFGQLCADSSLPPLQLKVGGYKSAGDEPYFESVLQRANELAVRDRFQYVGPLERPAKIEFLQSLDVAAVPTVYRESKGLSALEALANGVPIVVPRHGVFPELIDQTGGGLLCQPDDPTDLAAKLREFIVHRDLIDQYGRAGREAIHSRHTADLMANEHQGLYRKLHAAAAK